MHHIIYSSRATQTPTDNELIVLLLRSRQSNERVGITGALVYGGSRFMQVIEGEKAIVTALYERICCDSRHQDVRKLLDEPIEERIFIGWSMAFQRASPEQVLKLEGYISPEYWEQTFSASKSAETLLLQKLREVVLQGYNSCPPRDLKLRG